MRLRTTQLEASFNPGGQYDFARQIFNDARAAFLSVFPLPLLKKYAEKHLIIKVFHEACLVPDEGDEEFLRVHANYEELGRAIIPTFYA